MSVLLAVVLERIHIFVVELLFFSKCSLIVGQRQNVASVARSGGLPWGAAVGKVNDRNQRDPGNSLNLSSICCVTLGKSSSFSESISSIQAVVKMRSS